MAIACIILVIIYFASDSSPELCISVQSLSTAEERRTGGPFLVIVAEARSGSTWLGSFFKENEKVLHFFEPLDERVIDKVTNSSALSPSKKTQIQLEILANECQCKFKDVPVPVMGTIPIWSKSLYRLLGYVDEAGVVLPQYRKPKSMELAAKLKKVYPDLDRVEDFCKTRELVSAKIIRLTDVSELLKLQTMGCGNFKVLHLIRDPRPIIQSRMATFGELQTGNGAKSTKFSEAQIKEAAAGICNNYIKNVNMGRQQSFVGRYKLVLYEDIASDPVRYVEEMYKYVGLEMTSQVRNHIEISTHGETVKGTYEVVRNTAEVVERWKTDMDKDYIRWVEEVCSEMLDLFGYSKLF